MIHSLIDIDTQSIRGSSTCTINVLWHWPRTCFGEELTDTPWDANGSIMFTFNQTFNKYFIFQIHVLVFCLMTLQYFSFPIISRWLNASKLAGPHHRYSLILHLSFFYQVEKTVNDSELNSCSAWTLTSYQSYYIH